MFDNAVSRSTVTINETKRFVWHIDENTLSTYDPQKGWIQETIFIPILTEKPADFDGDCFDIFKNLDDANDHVWEAILAYEPK